ncbi:MAG: tRNA pseudouridine(38-40) synthase TruA [Bacilli bacterium]
MRYLIDFSYDGSEFYGIQKQPGLRTVQNEIEKVLTSINNRQVIIFPAGRTDAKVNALHQMAHFDFDTNISPVKLKGALNSYLPSDIRINDVVIVKDDFHARYMVKSKLYEYRINMGLYNPLERKYVFQYGKELNVNKIKQAAKYLEGTHDFTTFASSQDLRKNMVRTIDKIKVSVSKNVLSITFLGSGFLKYQVRNMIGLFIKIGEGKSNATCIPEYIDKKDRRLIGVTAPPEGLTLVKINYKKNSFI